MLFDHSLDKFEELLLVQVFLPVYLGDFIKGWRFLASATALIEVFEKDLKVVINFLILSHLVESNFSL